MKEDIEVLEEVVDRDLLHTFLGKKARRLYKNIVGYSENDSFLILKEDRVLDRVGYFGISLESEQSSQQELDYYVTLLLKNFNEWVEEGKVSGLTAPIQVVERNNGQRDVVILPIISENFLEQYETSGIDSYIKYVSQNFQLEDDL